MIAPPACEQDEAPGRPPPTPDPNPAAAPGLLVVDPDPAFRAECESTFGRLGWRVWTAAGPEDAARTLRGHAAEVRAAVVDLQFPGLQGARVLADLGRCAPGLVRCGMSADVAPYAAAAFRRLTDTPLFPKPFDFPAVSAALRDLLGSANSTDHPSRPGG